MRHANQSTAKDGPLNEGREMAMLITPKEHTELFTVIDYRTGRVLTKDVTANGMRWYCDKNRYLPHHKSGHKWFVIKQPTKAH